jgi:orotidine-5'-phosphate decarboxylase
MTKLIVALDKDSLAEALKIVDAAGDSVEWYKIGSQLFCKEGPAAVKAIKDKGKKVFLDLKFHDIPNTVANAVENSVKMGVDMVNVHASGGTEMMQRSVEAANNANNSGTLPLVIAVTVLTSMNEEGLSEVLDCVPTKSPATQVEHLAKLAKKSGMNGVVCSAHEIDIIRKACGEDFSLIVPGIRPTGAAVGDQKRVMTPKEAAEKGANFIVVGRPVLNAKSPSEAAIAINKELNI